jgi:archaellum component FlaC
MSLDEKREEAEAVLDSAEMTLETFGGRGKAARELKGKVSELENKIQDADSERELSSLIEDVRELMEKVEEEAGDAMMDEPGLGEPGAGGPPGDMPDDDMPPM